MVLELHQKEKNRIIYVLVVDIGLMRNKKMSEIKDIMDLLGRKHLDGNVRGTHLGQILMYLHKKKLESLKATLSKLALICGMSKRNVRENYIDGLEAFGIIQTKVISNDVYWNWIGIKALNDEETFMQYVTRQEKEKKENEEKTKGKNE